MESEFNEKMLMSRLRHLTIWKQILFVLYCCERMFPNYVLFVRETGWGSIKVIRSALDTAWETLADVKVNGDFSSTIAGCEKYAPDTEKFDSLYVSAALDAATSASLLLSIFAKFDQSRIVEVASLARDSVDLYVQEIEHINSNDADLEMKILKHPLMQMELRKQRESIELLERSKDDQKETVKALEKKWSNLEEGCLGVKI